MYFKQLTLIDRNRFKLLCMSNVMDSLSSSHDFALSDVLENSRYLLLSHPKSVYGNGRGIQQHDRMTVLTVFCGRGGREHDNTAVRQYKSFSGKGGTTGLIQ